MFGGLSSSGPALMTLQQPPPQLGQQVFGQMPLGGQTIQQMQPTPLGLQGNLGVPTGAAAVLAPEPESTFDDTSILKWVGASDGSVPEDAVEGGWCNSTQEPYYLARARHYDGQLCIGYVLKSKKTCVILPQFTHTLPSPAKFFDYEVLVNPDNAEKLSWVFVQNRKAVVTPPAMNPSQEVPELPESSLKVGDFQGQPIFFGRTCSPITGDLVPGFVTKRGNANIHMFVYAERNMCNPNSSGYEVLCFAAKEKSTKSIKYCCIYDIAYDLGGATVNWSEVSLDKATLLNKSTVEQSLKPLFHLNYSLTFKWEVSSVPDTELEIKGKVPFVYGGKENYHLRLLDGFQLWSVLSAVLPGSAAGGVLGMGFGGGGGNVAYAAHGGRVMPAANNSGALTGVFAPTVAAVKDTNSGFVWEKNVTCDGTKFRVPAHTQLIIEQQGHQVSLDVPFRAKLKIIYSNDYVENEEIEGMYRHTSVTAILPAVVGTKSVY